MNPALPREIVEACRRVLPPRRPLVLHEPSLGDLERQRVNECLASGWISTAGPWVERFEASLAALTKSKHVVATVNGTAALHAALLAAGVGPGDEVIVPALGFIATANAVVHCGAVPHLADVSASTLALDEAALEAHLTRVGERVDGVTVHRGTGRPIRAVVTMHTFGHPVPVAGLATVAARWGLALVEDAAEALGSVAQGRHAGTAGAVGILSFNGNKIVTTGGGGAIITDDPEIAKRARHLCSTARVPAGTRFVHDEVGYNYRMPSLNASLGIAQLERLPGMLERKRDLAARYEAAFAGLRGASFFRPSESDGSNHWLNTLLLDESEAGRLDEVLAALEADGIGARPAWTPMHELPMYSASPRMALPVTESLAKRIVNLPSSPDL